MKAAILTVGDEILIGQVVNTNAAFVGERLAAAGIDVVRSVVAPDDGAAIGAELRRATGAADAVIVTGGLGPTHDDLTKRCIAEFFGLPMASDAGERRRIGELLAARGIAWSDAAEEQATVPTGALLLPNRYGTAAGLVVERGGAIVIALPGVPYEMEQIFLESALPLLEARRGGPVAVHRTIRTAGIAESALAKLIGVPASLPEGVRLAFLPSLSGVRLRLDAGGATREEAAAHLAGTEAMIRERAAKYVYGEEDDELEDAVAKLLLAEGLTIGCAESCTGGAVARKLTRVPGSSAWFLGSIVAYSDRLKERLLGVAPEVIRMHGAVSRECALAMASGVRAATGASVGVSSTGIAGPSGGSPEKPVGTVWIGYEDAKGAVAMRFSFGEGRERVVERSAVSVLDLVRRKLLRME